MRVGGKAYRAVFIMGAGATRGAIPHVTVNLKRIRPPLNRDFFTVADTFVRAQGVNSRDGRRLRNLRRVFREEIPFRGLPHMEEAFSSLYVAKDLPEIYLARRGRKRNPARQNEIEDFLRLTFSILSLVDRVADSKTGYDRLASCLTPEDTVISLNYDTALDSSLWRRGWDPRVGYGLLGGPGKVRWQPSTSASDGELDGLKLFKLHGSLNWFVRGSFNRLAKVFESKPVQITRPRQHEIGGHIRQIVPPVFGKFFGHKHWKVLWKAAFEALRTADVLVIIGCSLVDTDFHLRALIGRLAKLRRDCGEPYVRTILVDRTKVRRKWMRILKGMAGRVTVYPGFEAFLTKELKV